MAGGPRPTPGLLGLICVALLELVSFERTNSFKIEVSCS